MSDAIVSGMLLRFRLRQSAVFSPNIVATEQRVGGALTASDDRPSVNKHVVQIYDTRNNSCCKHYITGSYGVLFANISIICCTTGWLRGTVVERRSLTGELSLSCARPAAGG